MEGGRTSFFLIGSVLLVIASVFPALGGEITFDGNEDYVQVPDSPSLNITNASITMEAKVRISGTTGNHWVLCKQGIDGIRSYGFYIANHSRTIYPSIHTSEQFFEGEVGDQVLDYDTWYHISVVYSGSKIRTYIDGVLNGEVDLSGNLLSNDRDLYIGGTYWSPQDTTNGSIDEVQIWNIARTQTEIQTTMNTGLTGTEAGLVGYWTFEILEDLGVNGDGVDDYRDYTFNNNHGDLFHTDNYRIAWMYVQRRFYETGIPTNRVGFAIETFDGVQVGSDSELSSVLLYDPSNALVSTGPVTVSNDAVLMGSYDCRIGNWTFEDDFTVSSGFYGDFSEPLSDGTYRLVVQMSDGSTVERSADFTFENDIPVASSRTFEILPDISGNIVWKWKLPESLILNDMGLQISGRIMICIYSGGSMSGIVLVTMPAHLNVLSIPENVVQQISSRGDLFHLSVVLQTIDGSNRSFSNNLELINFNTVVQHPVSDLDWDCDVDGDDLARFAENFGLTDTCLVSE